MFVLQSSVLGELLKGIVLIDASSLPSTQKCASYPPSVSEYHFGISRDNALDCSVLLPGMKSDSMPPSRQTSDSTTGAGCEAARQLFVYEYADICSGIQDRVWYTMG
jgi:hypothetical protein